MLRTRNSLKNTRAFSLGEVVISIAILSSGIVAAVGMMTYSMQLMKTSEKHVVATNLARSGIELLRSKRDSNWLFQSGNIRENWNLGFQEDTDSPIGYYRIDTEEIIDSLGQSVRICRDDRENASNILDIANLVSGAPEVGYIPAYLLYLNSGTGLYTHANESNPPSQYYRQLELSYETDEGCASNCNHVNIKSMVLWFEKGIAQSVVLESQLYDWYQRENTDYYDKEESNPCTFE